MHDTPNSFVWEIGHTSDFSTPAGQYCVPGQSGCDSYDTTRWLGFSPLQIKSVTFADGSTANKWAVVSDFGGTAEVNQYCPSYGGPYCTLPVVCLQRHQRGVQLRRRLPRHPVRLRAGRPVRDHPAMRWPVRPRLHLLRHSAQPQPLAAHRSASRA